MILLTDIKPEPIFDAGKTIESQIWATQCRFEKGKNYLITAPSGKGKSTLLHIIYGLRKDYTGSIFINEEKVEAYPSDNWSALRQNKLSIVFQDLRLFPNLTAFENIRLKNDLTAHHDETKIFQMAKALGIDNLLENPCSTLSYGQRQRVAIIRALCQPFDFLLLDEPFSHLDEANIQIASDLISNEVESQGAGLLLVSLGERYHFSYDKELIL